jgi:hypothetical protein
MSRVTSWEDDEPYPNATALFQSSVTNAILGKRGQALLLELEQALLAMPKKRLESNIVCRSGDVCMLGALKVHRDVMKGAKREAVLVGLQAVAEKWGQFASGMDYEDDDQTKELLQNLLGIKSNTLIWQLIYENDECNARTPEDRYQRMLKWVQARIRREGQAEAPFERLG